MLQASKCFQQIVRHIPLAVLIVDKDCRIIYSNSQAAALFGYPSAELLDSNMQLLLPKEPAGFNASPHQFTRDALVRRKDGTLITTQLTLSPLDGDFVACTLASFRDPCARQREEAGDQQMAAIVESADDAIITKSLDGLIRSWNPGAERLLGYRALDMIGESVTRLIPPHLQGEEVVILDQLRRGQRVAHFETRRRKSDGTDLDVSLTISPIRDRAGTIVGASKIMRNISDRKSAEESLRRSNAELQQLNVELDEFVYTASHDLRSPLTNIGCLTQWILDDDDSLGAETRDRLLLIQGRIERMKRLLSDIREYARSASTAELVGPPVWASSLLADVVAGLGVPPGFLVQVDDAVATVTVKRIPLVQVFHNLIGNAIKHHDRENGIIAVSVQSIGSKWRFDVRDDGPGIPAEYREEVFCMFKTLRPRDEIEGSGMGLALVRKIVSKLGGACGVEPAPTRGARFWFDWPKVSQTTDVAV
jgi:PAS domain S-box-containing protein